MLSLQFDPQAHAAWGFLFSLAFIHILGHIGYALSMNKQEVEKKWQARWQEAGVFEVDLDAAPQDKKFYHLNMFAYPSGNLHIGHWYNFAVSDIVARFTRRQGKTVLNPMGYDAFGLPAENAAIKNNLPPAQWTKQNIAKMREQLISTGGSFDWSKELSTADPEYYKWTQWMFLKMLEYSLAEKRQAPVNWCPRDQTILANEQVVGGKCERCGTEVVMRNIPQWVFKITNYAERLLNDLDALDWPAKTKAMQSNWIGRSEGAIIRFSIEGTCPGEGPVPVFTTRPDTLFGVTYLVIAPEHPLLAKLTTPEQALAVEEYVKSAQKKSELERTELQKDKTGVFTGSYAAHPLTGQPVPIWVADYVIGSYGTGAVMAVPAHDQRDIRFARQYNLPIKTVIEPISGNGKVGEKRQSIVAIVRNSLGEVLTLNWGPELGGHLFIGGGIHEGETPEEAARREITEETGYKNVKLLATSETIHHHYFAYSKNVQREIDCTGLLFELIDDEQTSQALEDNEQNKFTVSWMPADEARTSVRESLHHYVFAKFIDGEAYTGSGILTNSGRFNGLPSEEAKTAIVAALADQQKGETAVTYRLRDWIVSRQRYWGAPIPIIYCDKCGTVPVPEPDLPVRLPENVDFRPTGESPLARAPEFVNTTCPSCGSAAKRETDTLDTFVDSSWYFFRYLDPQNKTEFARQDRLAKWMPVDLYVGGAEHSVLHLLYARFLTKALFDHHLSPVPEPFQKLRHQGTILGPDGNKMSKSKGNVIDPDTLVTEHGADAVRMYLAFMGPYDQGGPWNPGGIKGVERFLCRVEKIVLGRHSESLPLGRDEESRDVAKRRHRTIKKVTEDTEALRFNTAISAMMEWVNELEKNGASPEDKLALVSLLNPYAPHISEELWEQLGKQQFLATKTWPEFDASQISEDTVTIAVQVNGKLRGTFEAPAGESQEALITTAKSLPNVSKYLTSEPSKSIVIPNKLVSFVS